MSEKKPKSTKDTSKKPASGKVTKPLRRASAAKSGKAGAKSAGSRKAKLFERIKKSDAEGARSAAKNSKSKRGFLGKASGASSRGGFEQDKNRFTKSLKKQGVCKRLVGQQV